MSDLRIWPSTDAEWLTLLDARARLGTPGSPSQFFFALDWQTEPNLAAAAKSRSMTSPFDTDAWPEVASILELRLAARLGGRGGGVSLSQPHIKALSEVVLTAVGALRGSRTSVPAVLEGFGAGTHQKLVPFGTPENPGTFLANDADSYYIWMFAEFGMHAIEKDIAASEWKELMKPLLRSAWFYSKRFPDILPLTSYLRPGPRLGDEARKRHDLEFTKIWIEEGQVAEAVLHRCLKLVTTVPELTLG